MTALTARIRIARVRGGKYIVEELALAEEGDGHVDIFRIPCERARTFPDKLEARAYGEGLAHDFVSHKYGEGTPCRIECRTVVRIPLQDQ